MMAEQVPRAKQGAFLNEHGKPSGSAGRQRQDAAAPRTATRHEDNRFFVALIIFLHKVFGL
jgi:hypothetical protein